MKIGTCIVMLAIIAIGTAFSSPLQNLTPLDKSEVKMDFLTDNPGAIILKLTCREFPEANVTDCQIDYRFPVGNTLYFANWQYEKLPDNRWVLVNKDKPLDNSRSSPLKSYFVKKQFLFEQPDATIDRIYIDQHKSGGQAVVLSIDSAVAYISYHLPPNKTPYSVQWLFQKQPDLTWTCIEKSVQKDVTPHSLEGKSIRWIEFRWRGEDAHLPNDAIKITEPAIVNAFVRAIPTIIRKEDHYWRPRATAIFHTETQQIWAAVFDHSIHFYYNKNEVKMSKEFATLFEQHVAPFLQPNAAQPGAAPDADSGRR